MKKTNYDKLLRDIKSPSLELEKEFKTLDDLKNRIDVPLPPTGWSKPNLILRYYALPILIMLFVVAGFVCIFFFRASLSSMFLIALIFYACLATPLLLGIAGFLLIRFWFFDRNRITGAVVRNVSKNFVIANFITTHRRMIKRVCQLEKDGISFKYNGERYIVDEEKCFIDDDRYPNGFWLPNLPNQLSLDIAQYIYKYLDAMRNPDDLKNFIDKNGNRMDISMSSKNLEIFNKNKIFSEFIQQITPETMKLLIGAFILIGCAFVAIIVIVAIK